MQIKSLKKSAGRAVRPGSLQMLEMAEAKPPCCGPPTTATGGVISEAVPGFVGWLKTAAGPVAQVATELTFRDHLGACQVRWGFRRMSYLVPPGLYALGTPTGEAAMVVTCNYKMTFDLVRRVLHGRNVWLLVLETHGVNVWCAAGKGTFGTRELVRRLKATRLAEIVGHRRLLLPILGAPGVAAHEVSKQTGFAVSYATLRAEDLPAYLDNKMTTTPAMRAVTFTWYERLVLIPVELVMAARTTLIVGCVLYIVGALAGGRTASLTLSLAYLGAVLTGVALGPLLLPWLPGKSFAGKGAIAGVAWVLVCYLMAGGSSWGVPTTTAAFLALPAVSAYYTLNFTGCTVYTSRSGVKKEMRLGLPLMGGAIAVSLILLVIGQFLP